MRLVAWRQFDFWLFGSVLLLCIFGVAMVSSAIAGSDTLADYPTRQIYFVAIGLVVIVGIAMINYHFWASISRTLYFAVVAFLVFIFVYGSARFGSARWIQTGLVLIQPSELAKIVLILVLSDYFGRSIDEPRDMRMIGRSLLLTGGIVIWIVLQPNLSTSIVLLVLWFVLLWISGLKVNYLVVFIIIGALGAAVAFPFLEDYQKLRVINFLFPDPNARHGNAYNVEQALITIGSGGWFGQGYGHGTQVQLRFLKVRHTDFIFSAIAEEFGFVGTMIVIGILAFVIYRCIQIGNKASDPFGSLICYGFAFLMFFQGAVNMAVNMNLMPVTGLTLPFVSYGGSSLLSMTFGIGIVESVALHRKGATHT